ncbi:MAG: hypothetical protein DMG97_25155 [Acidobacteria bacterium]|nr:MAG: hypothetical protein DMG97_25155 [Acidobacteriota bacterium]
MYLAVAQAHLGSATAATNEWQRALEIADTPEKALALAKYAEQTSVNDIADAAYSITIKMMPKNRGAYDGRLRLAMQAGHTSQAQSIAATIAQLWPDDAEARNQDAYLQLLLGVSDDAAKSARGTANCMPLGCSSAPRSATLSQEPVAFSRCQNAEIVSHRNSGTTRNRRRTARPAGRARGNSGG